MVATRLPTDVGADVAGRVVHCEEVRARLRSAPTRGGGAVCVCGETRRRDEIVLDGAVYVKVFESFMHVYVYGSSR